MEEAENEIRRFCLNKILETYPYCLECNVSEMRDKCPYYDPIDLSKDKSKSKQEYNKINN